MSLHFWTRSPRGPRPRLLDLGALELQLKERRLALALLPNWVLLLTFHTEVLDVQTPWPWWSYNFAWMRQSFFRWVTISYSITWQSWGEGDIPLTSVVRGHLADCPTMSFVLVCWHQAVHGTGKLLHSGFLKWNNNHDDIAEWAPKNTMSKASWLPSSPSSAAALPNPPSSLSSKPSSICASTTHSWSVHKCQPFYLLFGQC